MKTSRLGLTLVAALVGWCWIAEAQEAAAPQAKSPMYVGVKRCRLCHNLEKSGGQYAKWAASKHAKAFETLASPKALEIAKKKGIADPQKADECLSCHVTGHGEPADKFKESFVPANGVGCESCHGAGSNYITMKTMQGLRDKSLNHEDHGLVMPTKKTCDKCHNEKAIPSGKPVDWAADSAKIAHPIPAGFKRGAEPAGGAGE